MATDSTRALKKIDFGHIINLTVTAGQATTKGMVQKMSGALTIQDAQSGDDGIIGVALETAAAGARASVLLYAPVVPVKVGTGGSTRGLKQKVSSSNDGVTDVPTATNGATVNQIVGIAMESGVAADFIGMMMVAGTRYSA